VKYEPQILAYIFCILFHVPSFMFQE